MTPSTTKRAPTPLEAAFKAGGIKNRFQLAQMDAVRVATAVGRAQEQSPDLAKVLLSHLQNDQDTWFIRLESILNNHKVLQYPTLVAELLENSKTAYADSESTHEHRLLSAIQEWMEAWIKATPQTASALGETMHVLINKNTPKLTSAMHDKGLVGDAIYSMDYVFSLNRDSGGVSAEDFQSMLHQGTFLLHHLSDLGHKVGLESLNLAIHLQEEDGTAEVAIEAVLNTLPTLDSIRQNRLSAVGRKALKRCPRWRAHQLGQVVANRQNDDTRSRPRRSL
jgi:hypothetical protein